MNLARIEQLVQEKADQRAEEVFGLFFVLFSKQAIKVSTDERFLYSSNILVIDGEEIPDVHHIDVRILNESTVEVGYLSLKMGYHTRIFKDIKIIQEEVTSKIIFSENSFLRVNKL